MRASEPASRRANERTSERTRDRSIDLKSNRKPDMAPGSQIEAPKRMAEATKRLYANLLAKPLDERQLARPTFKLIQDIVKSVGERGGGAFFPRPALLLALSSLCRLSLAP